MQNASVCEHPVPPLCNKTIQEEREYGMFLSYCR